MRALNIIESAYRATLEEQDDTIVWLCHALKGAGADLDVLLRANAVNYAVKSQSVAPLAFGDRQQKKAPRLAEDVGALVSKGVTVYVVKEDLERRGIGQEETIDGLTPLLASQLPKLLQGYDQVWHW